MPPGAPSSFGAPRNPTIPPSSLRRRRLLPSLATALTLLLIGGLVFAGTYKFKYVVIRPGSASDVNKRVVVFGVEDYPDDQGKVLWATVGLVTEPKLFDMFDAWLRNDVDAEPRRDVIGPQTLEENRAQSKIDMADSKLVAAVVAARRLQYPTHGKGVLVQGVAKEVPAAKVLRKGDVILAANGHDLCFPSDLRSVVGPLRAAAIVELNIVRAGEAQTVFVQTVVSEGRTLIGIEADVPQDAGCTVPFEVKIDTARVGGPSAGLAMTLAVLDRLTPGSLTGEQIVAATGEMGPDEAVLAVGGVKQKTYAVKAAGAKLFLVPKGEVTEARAHAGSMKVVGVATLSDALRALEELGGTPLPAEARQPGGPAAVAPTTTTTLPG